MSTFITEEWLRAHYSLSQGTEIHLPDDARLTPSAQTLIQERQLKTKYYDEQGRLFVPELTETTSEKPEEPTLKAVHALTSQTHFDAGHCELCHQVITQKPDTLTHLNAQRLVAKNDPRLQFRAQLDSCIAQAIVLQCEIENEANMWLADIRSVLGNIMRADVLGEPLADFAIADLDAETIHQLSHKPLPYLGHDHIVPEVQHGKIVAQLNLLRTKIRETEIAAAMIFIQRDFTVSRPDLMQAINRLSSAVYILMLLCLLKKQGHAWPSAESLNAKIGKSK